MNFTIAPIIFVPYSCTIYTPHHTTPAHHTTPQKKQKKDKADDGDSIPTGLSMDKQKSNR